MDKALGLRKGKALNGDEATLASKAVAGDRDALSALLEASGPRVRGMLAGSIPLRWQSLLSMDDLMQEAYADAFVNIARFGWRGEGSFTAWLASLARCNLLDAVRMLEAEKRGGDRVRVRGTPAWDDSCVDLFHTLAAGATTPSRAARRDEARAALLRAVEGLPESQRRVVEQYDLEHRPAAEVASSIGRSEGAVYMLRARAHRALAGAMGGASNHLSAP